MTWITNLSRCANLALAQLRGCEFWTADERLYNAVSKELEWVKWVGNSLRDRIGEKYA